jgi:hypothetical protein
MAKNVLREMRCGDRAFFYHSNCKPPGIVGVVEVCVCVCVCVCGGGVCGGGADWWALLGWGGAWEGRQAGCRTSAHFVVRPGVQIVRESYPDPSQLLRADCAGVVPRPLPVIACRLCGSRTQTPPSLTPAVHITTPLPLRTSPSGWPWTASWWGGVVGGGLWWGLGGALTCMFPCRHGHTDPHPTLTPTSLRDTRTKALACDSQC